MVFQCILVSSKKGRPQANRPDRRDFFKKAAAGGTVAAAAVLSLSGIASTECRGPRDKVVDIACVGYGGAGAITAITAADLRAKVLILEKQLADTSGEVRHTPNTRLSGELGSVYGFLYPTSGGNLAEMIAFGRIAAQSAVSEKPWS